VHERRRNEAKRPLVRGCLRMWLLDLPMSRPCCGPMPSMLGRVSIASDTSKSCETTNDSLGAQIPDADAHEHELHASARSAIALSVPGFARRSCSEVLHGTLQVEPKETPRDEQLPIVVSSPSASSNPAGASDIRRHSVVGIQAAANGVDRSDVDHDGHDDRAGV
jgi:hypothetical protein